MSTLSIAPQAVIPQQARRVAAPSRPAPRTVARPSTRDVARPVPVRRAPAPRSSSAPLRLTRRGRIVLTLLLLGLVLVASTLLGGRSAATGQGGTPLHTRTVVVDKGDTLWAIASEVAAPGQIREVVHQIEKLNALPDATLVEGQKLAVPVP